jgi:hypothetical protein
MQKVSGILIELVAETLPWLRLAFRWTTRRTLLFEGRVPRQARPVPGE